MNEQQQAGIEIGYATNQEGLDYVFQEGVILVRDEYLTQVQVGGRQQRQPAPVLAGRPGRRAGRGADVPDGRERPPRGGRVA